MLYLYIGIAVLFVLIACYSGFKEKKYKVLTDKNIKDTKVVLLSDLHSKRSGKRLVSFIKKHKPDMVMLVGDLFDSRRKPRGAMELVESLPETCPYFFVSGNHEHRGGKWATLKGYLIQNGINVLEEETKTLDGLNITVSGVSDIRKKDYDDDTYTMEGALKKLSPKDNSFNILLSHSPFFVKYFTDKGFDLVLSGHTHGGQVRIPLVLNGLFCRSYPKRFGFFPKYCGGKYKVSDLSLIVGRGCANNPGWVPRVFNRKELIVIDIKKRDC